MKTCVSSYSFHKFIATGRMTQLDTIKASKELDFDAIEIADLFPHDNATPEEHALRLREEADRVGLPIVSFVFGADLMGGSGGRSVDEEIDHVKRMVRVGKILGVPHVRHDVLYSLGEYGSFEELLPVLSCRVREISEYAQMLGIKTCVENHGFICQDPDRLVALYNAVNHPNFGLLCDIGNFLCADAEPLGSVTETAPYAIFAHAKDFYVKSKNENNPGPGYFTSRGGNYLKGTVLGHGNVPVRACLSALSAAGYNGYVSLEFEGMEDPIEALTIGRENFLRFVENL